MKVLLFCEDAINLIVTERILFPEFEIFAFSSLRDANHWAQRHDFDILLAEYTRDNLILLLQLMNQMKEVRGDVFRSVVSAAYIAGGEATQLVEAGYENIFVKPLSKRQFLDYFEYAG
jgi:hypothetical protein